MAASAKIRKGDAKQAKKEEELDVPKKISHRESLKKPLSNSMTHVKKALRYSDQRIQKSETDQASSNP